MNKLINLFLLLFCINSFAQPSGGVPIAQALANGVSLLLFNAPGSCVNGALRAEWREGATTLHGCWKVVPEGVQIVFMDADALVLPVNLFTKPKEI